MTKVSEQIKDSRFLLAFRGEAPYAAIVEGWDALLAAIQTEYTVDAEEHTELIERLEDADGWSFDDSRAGWLPWHYREDTGEIGCMEIYRIIEGEPCAGCGLREDHKACPAHGTPAYMNREHPAWGSVHRILSLRQPATPPPELAALRAECEQYKQCYRHALDCVDRVFQVCSEIPNPVLPDFCQLGESKFAACVRLADEYVSLQAQLTAALARAERLEGALREIAELTERRQLPLTAQINDAAREALAAK